MQAEDLRERERRITHDIDLDQLAFLAPRDVCVHRKPRTVRAKGPNDGNRQAEGALVFGRRARRRGGEQGAEGAVKEEEKADACETARQSPSPSSIWQHGRVVGHEQRRLLVHASHARAGQRTYRHEPSMLARELGSISNRLVHVADAIWT
jgi:hypothetical protein